MALNIIQYIYFLILFACVLYSNSLFFFKRNKNDLLFIYLTIIFVIDFTVLLFFKIKEKNLSWLYNISDVITVLFLSYYIKKQFKNKLKLLVPTGIFLSLLILYISLGKSGYMLENGIITGLYVIGVSIMFFYFLIKVKTLEEIKIIEIPAFWFIISFLLSSVFFIFRLIPRFYFQNLNANFMESIRIFFLIINIVMYLLIMVALTKYSKNKAQKTNENVAQ